MTAKKSTDSWLAHLEAPLRPLAETLRRIVLDACPELDESIKWGNPVYRQEGNACYLAATRAYVSLDFFDGAAPVNPHGILEGAGKRMRHVKVRNHNGIRRAQFASWVREAVELNRQRWNPQREFAPKERPQGKHPGASL